MNYYTISLIGSPLGEFTYQSNEDIKIGTIVEVDVRNRVTRGVVISECEKPDFDTNDILDISELYYDAKGIELAKFISTYYICSLGDAFGVMVPFDEGVGMPSHTKCGNEDKVELGGESAFTLGTDGLPSAVLDSEEDKVEGKPSVPKSPSSSILSYPCGTPDVELTLTQNIELSPKQEEALAVLKKHKVSLLFGDTGSGKTEIYMKYFEMMLRESKRCIFLMPEISLTPQMGIRLEAHFGDKVVMYHSKLTPKQKKLSLEKIRNGDAKIIAGPRSSLFLPIKDLGLIVIDEEHDDSYKSSSRPRYNARDLAIYMGKIHNIPVVLGSATPSVNTFIKFKYARLKGGFFSSNREFIYEKSSENLSPLIMNELKNILDKKEQAIVFVPTRGNFKHLICNSCGHHYECVFCSIGMSVHNKSNALKCHYCNYTQAIPQRCSSCSSDTLVSSRLGTAEALKSITEQFSEASIEQFDRDTITTSSKLKKALQRFNDTKTDILVGTQMLSKGHDYHGVTLAVVLGMDNMLNMGDYRAREKALSSLLQVAGRAGRAKNAKVLVQSFNEDFFKTYLNDYEAFLEEEKEYRKELYPPYKKLARILFSHKNGAKARESMDMMLSNLSRFDKVEVVGYGKCGVERIANKYRFEILLRSDKSTELIKAITTSKVSLAEVDMDPIEFG